MDILHDEHSMTSAKIEIRMDQQLLDAAEAVGARLGMDLETAVRIFLKELVLENDLPFRPKADPLFSPANIRHLERLHDDYKAGRKTELHELIQSEPEDLSPATAS